MLGEKKMKTMLDVRNILKQFGIFVYTGNRIADLDMISSELDDLFKMGLIAAPTYQTAKLIVKKERRNLKTK